MNNLNKTNIGSIEDFKTLETQKLEDKKDRKARILNLQRIMVLNQMNVEIKKGERLCVTSHSEDMMSNFVLTLRGETYITQGSIELNGKVVFIDSNR